MHVTTAPGGRAASSRGMQREYLNRGSTEVVVEVAMAVGSGIAPSLAA